MNNKYAIILLTYAEEKNQQIYLQLGSFYFEYTNLMF